MSLGLSDAILVMLLRPRFSPLVVSLHRQITSSVALPWRRQVASSHLQGSQIVHHNADHDCRPPRVTCRQWIPSTCSHLWRLPCCVTWQTFHSKHKSARWPPASARRLHVEPLGPRSSAPRRPWTALVVSTPSSLCSQSELSSPDG